MEGYDDSKNGKLKALRGTLNEKLGVLSDLDSSILNQVEDEEIEKEIEQSSELKAEIQERIVNIDLAITAISSNSGSEDEKESVSSAGSIKSWKKSGKIGQCTKKITQTVKLLKLVIKKFTGNHVEYQAFWDSFEAAIHTNESLNDIEKLNYLRTYLEGPAAAGLALTKENYATAVELLRDRYGNKQMIISSHMDSMLKIPRVVSAMDIEQVRMVYDKIEINVRSLQALGIKSEMYGSLLIPVIMDKISEEFRLIVNRKMKSDTWDINELMAAFKEELEARKKSKFVGGNINVVEKPWLKSKKVYDPGTAAALHVTERVQTNCYFCNHQGHKSFNYILVTDPERQREILKRKGGCFVYLRTGHVANHCQSELTCNKCNGRHHGSLCRSGFQSPPAGNNVTQPSTSHVTQPSTSEQSSGATAVDQSQGTTSTFYVNAKTSVLLQTATATVSNPKSLKSVQARLIFNSGLQRSYISSRIRNALELPSLHSENLVIKTFGPDSDRPK